MKMKILTIATSKNLMRATQWQRMDQGWVATGEHEGEGPGGLSGVILDGVDLILASGAIASGELALTVPGGLFELAAAMVSSSLPETGDRPVWLIPGVRTLCSDIGLHNSEAMDRMAGEETAAIGLIDSLKLQDEAIAVFAGSRTRFVRLDREQRIAGSAASMSTELFEALCAMTGGQGEADEPLDAEMLATGARYGRDFGLGRIAVLVRQLEHYCPYGHAQRISFLLGAVLGADLQTLKNSRALRINPASRFVIAGEPRFAEAFRLLIADDGFFSGPLSVVAETQASLAGWGALALARARGLIPS
ncbi:2-dehydro-3-deoxygalactonokinase [Niveibacterium terrae]|uniref:2-dehydro-3-deoxygalactonokinase n=1 Tax=Niveibacterium terrae TaxID=3373598 RepID=UPI003A926C13